MNNELDALNTAHEYCEDCEYDLALKYYDMILKISPDSIDVLVDKGVTTQNLGLLNYSLYLYDCALKVDPYNIIALTNKGSVLHTMKKYNEAITCYNKALELNTRQPMTLAYKGLSLAEQGELKLALEYFKKALMIDEMYDVANIGKNTILKILNLSKSKP